MDPRETSPKYTTRLQKGGALLDDMRLLVQNWDERPAWEDQVQLGLRSNLLGKETWARSSDVIRRAFSHRFVKGDPPNAWLIVRAIENRCVCLDVLKPLYYWITARSDALLYDFVTDFLSAQSRSPGLHIRIEEVAAWITNSLRVNGQEWTPTVTLKVGRGILAALRDFGILEGASRKRLAPVYLPIESFAYLAFLLNQLGSSGSNLVNHPDWRLFLLPPSLVEKLFLEAHQRGLLRYEAAGNLYRIDFHADTLEEMADVIARRTT